LEEAAAQFNIPLDVLTAAIGQIKAKQNENLQSNQG
jgi:hypothetical protein